jgi:hypothetical protein
MSAHSAMVRIQAGDAIPVTQATNTPSAFGYAFNGRIALVRCETDTRSYRTP